MHDQYSGLAIGSLLMLAMSSAYAAPYCQTYETCSVNANCSCVIMPSSGYDRYFYWTFPGILKSNNYSCHFKDSLSIPVVDSITVPAGSKYQSSGNYPHFPVDIALNSQNMLSKIGALDLKILIPAGDYPTTLTMSCATSENYPILSHVMP